MKQFLKQLFCSHIDELIDRKYLYSSGMRILGEFHPSCEYYAVTFRCVKCGKVHMEKLAIDII